MKKKWLEHYQEGVPESIPYPEDPLSENLVRSSKDFPDAVATSLFGNDQTYRQVNETANAVAHALIDLGVRPKDRVAILLPNTPSFVTAYYGILKAGAFAVPTNPLYTPRELEYQLNDSGETEKYHHRPLWRNRHEGRACHTVSRYSRKIPEDRAAGRY
jgi:long-chain acyl-CoA synthetase